MAVALPQPPECVEEDRVSLYEDMMVPCVRLVKSGVPDGEGGQRSEWVEGGEFSAAIHRESDSGTLIAEQQGMATIYTITTEKGVHMAFHDVFRRISDSATFRITSDSSKRQTPDVATFAFERATAQEWEPEE